MSNYSVTRAGWYWFGALLFLGVFFAAIITVPLVGLANEQPKATPTPTSVPCADEDYPAYQPGTIYLAKPDGNGHYLVVSTDNLCVARDEQELGFYPVPAEYADELRGK